MALPIAGARPLNPMPLGFRLSQQGRLTLQIVALAYMIRRDKELDADRFFLAKAGLDRGRLGTGYQDIAVLFRREELRGVMG